MRGEAFNFSRLGTFIERADDTARILDVKYHILLPRIEDVGGARDYYQWAALLRSVSSFETYRTIYRDQIYPINVAELLILDRRMPRSLAACLEEIDHALSLVDGQNDQPVEASCRESFRRGSSTATSKRSSAAACTNISPTSCRTSTSSATASSAPTSGRYENLDRSVDALRVRAPRALQHAVSAARAAERCAPAGARLDASRRPRTPIELRDGYGNILHVLTIEKPVTEIVIRVCGRGRDERQDRRDAGRTQALAARFPAAWTAHARRRRRSSNSPSSSGVARPRCRACARFRDAVLAKLPFQPGVTAVHSTATEAFEAGNGVCQDHAHVFIACCRFLGVPARYVSGYLYIEPRFGGGPVASHAWAEAWVVDRWRSFDITNGASGRRAARAHRGRRGLPRRLSRARDPLRRRRRAHGRGRDRGGAVASVHARY